MAKKKSGKVLVVFLIITAVLMATLAAIAAFFFQLEIGERKAAEAQVEQHVSQSEEFQVTITELQKSTFLLEEKNKEADDRINSLLDELDLQEGLREEMKNETASLRESLEKENIVKDKMRKQITQIETEYKDKIKALDTKLNVEVARYRELKEKYSALVDQGDVSTNGESIPVKKSIEGKVINVDSETEFIIISIGQEEGIIDGQLLSVYRNEKYIGDIKVTRAQSGMSAADPVAPLTIDSIVKSDQVIVR